MFNFIRRLALPAVLAATIAAPNTGSALGVSTDYDQVVYMSGHGPTGTCRLNPYITVGGEAGVDMIGYGGIGYGSAGGSYWNIGGVISTASDITSAQVAGHCSLSDVTSFTSDGANGTFASDDFMGVSFRATDNRDSKTYDYVFGLSGATNTVLVNTRTEVANTPATANAGPDQTVASGVSVTLTGAGSSANDLGQALTYAWAQDSGTAVTIVGGTTVSPSFVAPTLVAGAPSITLEFSLIVNDTVADSAADTVSITVTSPANTTATANAGTDQTVASGASVTLNGSASSSNDAGQALSYAWSQSSGPTVAITGGTTSGPTFTAPTLLPGASDTDLVFSLTVNDGVADSAADTISVTVTAPANVVATANAGTDQTVASAASVTLDGSGSSSNNAGQPLTYAWTQSSGTTVVLTGGTTSGPTFPAPTLIAGAADVTLVFSLVVNDTISDSAADTVSITVTSPADTPATANAGADQTVASGASVTLNGAASSANDAGQPLTYAWSQTSGTTVSLTGDTTSGPTFDAPTLIAGSPSTSLTFSLTVNDGVTTSVADTVTITVNSPANTAATANAGTDQSVSSAAGVTLDGSGSSANDAGQALTYAWTQSSGTTVALGGSTTSAPTFTAPTLIAGAADATLVFSLTVNDGVADSAADTVSVTVSSTPNTAPTANAGPDQTVASGAGVTLNGTGSDANDAGQALTYVWTQTSGTTVGLTGGTTSGPTFAAPTLVAGAASATLVFSLTVHDGVENSVADTVSITVTSPTDTPATANAGPDQTVASGAGVTLDGTASDANDVGQVLGYAWTQSSGTDVTVTGGTTSGPTFTAPTLIAGAPSTTLVFSLVVNDGVADSTADTVSITVTSPADTPASSNAGADQTVASGAGVTLDGSASDANDIGQPLTYAWTQSSGTAVSLTGATTSGPTFSAPTLAIGASDTTLVFSLVVNDGVADSSADTVSVTITAPANTPATANAGPDQSVAAGAAVTLDGSGSSSNDSGQALTYAWTQTSGTTVALTGATTAAPTFEAPALSIGDSDLTLEFKLTVNDTFVDAEDSVSITVLAPLDVTRPTVAITGAPTTYEAGTPFDVTVAFSEGVLNFVAGDITVANGSVTALSGSGDSYTAQITPAGSSGDIDISVAENVANDSSGNQNMASAVVSVAANTAERAQLAISKALMTRARAFLSGRPNLRRLLAGGFGNAFNANASHQKGAFQFAGGGTSPVWFTGSGTWTSDDGATQGYGLFSLGTQIWKSETAIAGAMLQFDTTETTLTDGVFSAQGWLAGPYFVARHPDQPLVFSASFLHGLSNNTLTLTGLPTETFTSTRTIATVGVEGQIKLANGVSLIPSLDLAHFVEQQSAYTDSFSSLVAAQKLELTEATFGLGFVAPIKFERTDAVFTGGLNGVYARSQSTLESTESLRARVDLGVQIALTNGGTLSVSTYYDGIGQDTYESVGANLTFEFEF